MPLTSLIQKSAVQCTQPPAREHHIKKADDAKQPKGGLAYEDCPRKGAYRYTRTGYRLTDVAAVSSVLHPQSIMVACMKLVMETEGMGENSSRCIIICLLNGTNGRDFAGPRRKEDPNSCLPCALKLRWAQLVGGPALYAVPEQQCSARDRRTISPLQP